MGRHQVLAIHRRELFSGGPGIYEFIRTNVVTAGHLTREAIDRAIQAGLRA